MKKKHDLEEESGSTVGGIAGYHSGTGGRMGIFRSDIKKREKNFPRKKAKKDFFKKKNPKKKVPPTQWEEIEEGFVSPLVTLLNESDTRVATEILRQIKVLDKRALMAWGAKDFISDRKSVTFRVRGSKMKTGGKIRITLNGRDLYDIEAFRIRVPKVTLLKKLKDIDVENLVRSIDSLVG